VAGLVRDSLARVEPDAAAPSAGPGEADIAAANEMSPEQRDTMIRGMVVRLADRLKQDGSDVEGWLPLDPRLYGAGRQGPGARRRGDARRALAGDPDKLRRVDDLVKGLGLEG